MKVLTFEDHEILTFQHWSRAFLSCSSLLFFCPSQKQTIYNYLWLSHANQNSTLRDQLKVIFRKTSERKTVQTALNENN